MFATNNDLMKYAPDAFEHGVDDWTDELAMAQTDVEQYVQVKFWNNHRSTTKFDATRLTQAQWTKATVFRALASYILPKLATFRVDDVFVEQMKHWKERFSEEMDIQFAIGVQYDLDENGTIEENEVATYKQDRLYR